MTIAAPPTSMGLTLAAPPTSGLTSAAPPTSGLTSAIPSIRKGFTSVTPLISRLTLAGLFFTRKFILAKMEAITALLALQTALFSFMTRKSARIRFLGHVIMISRWMPKKVILLI